MRRLIKPTVVLFALASLAFVASGGLSLLTDESECLYDLPCPPVTIRMDWPERVRMFEPMPVTITVWPHETIHDLKITFGTMSLGTHVEGPREWTMDALPYWPIRVTTIVRFPYVGCDYASATASYTVDASAPGLQGRRGVSDDDTVCPQ
jgi:hypothetical protein